MKIGNEFISVVVSEQLDDKIITLMTDATADLRTRRKTLRKQLEQLLEHGVDLSFNIIEGTFERSFSIHYKKDNIHPDYYVDVVDKLIKYMFTQQRQDLKDYIEESSFLDDLKDSTKCIWFKLKRWLNKLSDKMNGLGDYTKDVAMPKLVAGAKVAYGSMQASLSKATDNLMIDYLLDCKKATSEITTYISELDKCFEQKGELYVKAIYDMKQLIVKMQSSNQSVNSVDLLNVILDLTKCIEVRGEPLNHANEPIKNDSVSNDSKDSNKNLQEFLEVGEKSLSNSTYIIDENVNEDSNEFTVESLYSVEVNNFMKNIFVKVH